MVGRLVLGGRHIAAGRVETLAVPLVDPARRGELDVVDCAPGPLTVDELGLVGAVDGLREGVVVAVAARAHGVDRARLGEPFGIADGEVLVPRSE
jgi:hypothetical protein